VFSEGGDLIAASSRKKHNLKSLRRAIENAGGTCEVFPCDVRNEAQVRKTAGLIRKKLRRVDVLVNNAGITYFKDFVSTSIREFDNVLATNLRGLFLTTRTVLPSMIKRKKGLVINILSFAAKTVYTKSAAYSASKSGAEAMMNVLRAETRDSGVKIINVYPGAVLTPMWQKHHRKKYAAKMLNTSSVARCVYETSIQEPSLMVEEVIIRPQGGDLRV